MNKDKRRAYQYHDNKADDGELLEWLSEKEISIQELTAKLHDERAITSDQNARIAQLEQCSGEMVAFIAAFELWLKANMAMPEYTGCLPGESSSVWDDGYNSARMETAYKIKTLKAQHLGEKENEDDD